MGKLPRTYSTPYGGGALMAGRGGVERRQHHVVGPLTQFERVSEWGRPACSGVRSGMHWRLSSSVRATSKDAAPASSLLGVRGVLLTGFRY
jgi:hypothetical protein